jgi:(1->4)-alpha-D-glucan 1-alpha-D-glucosylmutase
MPGVPDVYQGCELVDLSLVDPDNRRPVDYATRVERLRALDEGAAPADLDDEKLLVVSRALRLRREHPDWFGAESSYVPVETTSTHAVAFARAGKVVTVVSRLTTGLRDGWGDAVVRLPEGVWRDLLTGDTYGGEQPVATLLGALPVALLSLVEA